MVLNMVLIVVPNLVLNSISLDLFNGLWSEIRNGPLSNVLSPVVFILVWNIRAASK